MNVYQSIETRYIGPTNHRGSRIVATTPGGHRLIHNYDYALNVDGNHYAAADKLREKLDWPAIVAGGSTKAGYAWLTSVLKD